MSLKDQLKADVIAAMKAKDVQRRTVLRSLQAAIKQIEIDSRTTLDDEGVLKVITKQAKQRKESIADSERAGRDDLIVQYKAELDIIEAYLPQMMSEDEVRAVASKIVAEMGVSDMRGMGQIMGRVMGQLKGQADGKVVSKVVRDLLNQ